MECPVCGEELKWDDCYGPYIGNGEIERVGDIYWCGNGQCEAGYFYTDSEGTLHEGYPC